VLQIQLLEPVVLSAFSILAKTLDSLLALSMEVDALDATRELVEADVVEAFEARTAYSPDSVIRDEEILLPSHEQMLLLIQVLRHLFLARGVFGYRLVCIEAPPVLPVDLFVGAPFRMLCNEGVFASDDLAFEVRCQAWVVFGQTYGLVSLRALCGATKAGAHL
jgi:hypothetical protein